MRSNKSVLQGLEMLVLLFFIICLVSSCQNLFLFFLYLCHFWVKLYFLYTSLPSAYLFNFSYPRLFCHRQYLDLPPCDHLLVIIIQPSNVYITRRGNHTVPITHKDTEAQSSSVISLCLRDTSFKPKLFLF